MVFLMNHTVNGRLTQPLKNAGGWKKALDTIQDPAVLPKSVGDRIYLLGTFDEPKDLKEACGLKLEDIGRQLAQDCPPAPTYGLWSHAHLQHNAAELERLVAQVRPFLFRS